MKLIGERFIPARGEADGDSSRGIWAWTLTYLVMSFALGLSPMIGGLGSDSGGGILLFICAIGVGAFALGTYTWMLRRPGFKLGGGAGPFMREWMNPKCLAQGALAGLISQAFLLAGIASRGYLETQFVGKMATNAAAQMALASLVGIIFALKAAQTRGLRWKIDLIAGLALCVLSAIAAVLTLSDALGVPPAVLPGLLTR